ncbi:TIGR02217 family protein [Sandaracinobacter neustonicus]|uniref:TIGR02217 family protein n=1 Tax=Sandaracinobacter neustonicus TaxID=1715348 RepID=A0A501XDD3_9SPHN|nr:DUF2460 domain-containing protein [Sandaracinobacter neustonicus]TPE58522.1 TIGR02217 family protein [Sandaracinobacter neustonicus]
MVEVPAYLASREDQVRTGWVKRFRPQLWTVDFARPMMAAVTAPQLGLVRLDLDFLTKGDLAGLIWESEDRWSHPLLAYATDRDYRGCRLRFDWVSGPGVMALDALNGPVLTLEGRDAAGVARTWYVRLWNYAVVSGTSAAISLEFDQLRAGFGTDGEPVYAGDIDRMFISMVPVGFDGSSGALAAPVSSWVELRNLRADGLRTMLAVGDAFLPPHGLRMSSGYDDSYHQAPERLIEQWEALGYRALANHYVGMSHYYALSHVGAGRFEVAGGLCGAAVAWHRRLLQAGGEAGFELILSLSFELFDANAPAGWAQRDKDGERALTGWLPPSTLLSPCNGQAMGWLQGIARAFAGLAAETSQLVQFQVGEPWWWVGQAGKPCFYDAATVGRWTVETGSTPPLMADVVGGRTAAERAFLDWLGARLAEATLALSGAAASVTGAGYRSHLLFYAPQVLDVDKPELWRANMPVGWAWPAWDVLQLEDYDFVTAGNEAGMARGVEAVDARLGYPAEAQHYLAGFVLNAADAQKQWPLIAAAAAHARDRGVAEHFLWAWPQVARDGFTWLELGPAPGAEDVMDEFHDVRFPLDTGFEAVGGPGFSTQVAVLASGYEQRNAMWQGARLSYDAGLGVRSEADLALLLAFFRARRGRAIAFRFRDPMDWTSAPFGEAVSAEDQLLGVGDGQALSFQLVKRYGAEAGSEVRRISRPYDGSVRISVGGVEPDGGWTLQPGGLIRFEDPPGAGAEVRAGFEFDVPVRFDVDRLQISLSGVRAGEAQAVPLVEVFE